MDNFLPENYQKPETSDYFKLKEGENTFRVLSSAITGYKYWTEDNKPVRTKEPIRSQPANIKVEKDGSYRIQHFWAFLVWNHEAKKVQVFEVTQSSIQQGMLALLHNKKWGEFKGNNGYDISIMRSGEGLDTEYSVVPNPRAVLELSEKDEEKVMNAELGNLFVGKQVWQKGQ